MNRKPQTPLLSVLALTAIALTNSALLPSANANFITNGGFENFTSEFDFGDSTGGVTDQGVARSRLDADLGSGWILNFPDVYVTNSDSYFKLGAGGGPRSGRYAAVFPNLQVYDGSISQTISGLTAGEKYSLSFWLDNQLGDYPANSMTVQWGGTTLTGFATVLSLTSGWTQYTREVVASAIPANNTLTFIGGNDAAGNLLDDVSLERVPEFSSFGVNMLIGLLFLWIFGRATKTRRIQDRLNIATSTMRGARN